MRLLLLMLPSLLCAATGMWVRYSHCWKWGGPWTICREGGEGVSWTAVSQGLGAESGTRAVMPAKSCAGWRRNAG